MVLPGKKGYQAIFGTVGSAKTSSFQISKLLCPPPWGKKYICNNLQTRFLIKMTILYIYNVSHTYYAI